MQYYSDPRSEDTPASYRGGECVLIWRAWYTYNSFVVGVIFASCPRQSLAPFVNVVGIVGSQPRANFGEIWSTLEPSREIALPPSAPQRSSKCTVNHDRIIYSRQEYHHINTPAREG